MKEQFMWEELLVHQYQMKTNVFMKSKSLRELIQRIETQLKNNLRNIM